VEEGGVGAEDEVDQEEDKERRARHLINLSKSHPTSQRQGHVEDA
jgi:hypothetical protein